MVQESILEALAITFIVVNIMIIAEYINLLSIGRMSSFLKGNRWFGYLVSSFLGALPGCLGPFIVVSFYMHGFLSFGALMGAMIATSGDESYLMLSLFPGKALLLFFILFLSGIIFGWLSDLILGKFKVEALKCDFECKLEESISILSKPIFSSLKKISVKRHGVFLILLLVFLFVFTYEDEDWLKMTILVVSGLSFFVFATASDHYLEGHVFKHILFKHGLKVFSWVFGMILFMKFLFSYLDISTLFEEKQGLIFIIAALVGLIPESGPHLFFSLAYSRGLVPFSVLFVNSFIQDGHGLLPLFSHSIKTALVVKLVKFLFGVVVGGIIHFMGF
ncbi:MAG: arsenic efflux protein [Synergistetes bacterium]|nr:arsenic efflux protein [Synergistota bacterium]MCX8127502.1 arsenic efflux protein [Synergistota bacterium]MDW8191582.1 putative manganese transporter [Synergistota bacterium]